MDNNYISAYEYEKNVNPTLNKISFHEKNISTCEFGIHFINFSELFHVPYHSTTPNLLASFIKLYYGQDSIDINNKSFDEFNSTSHLFYVLQGRASFCIDNNFTREIDKGDILISPCFKTLKISNIGDNELQIYYYIYFIYKLI